MPDPTYAIFALLKGCIFLSIIPKKHLNAKLQVGIFPDALYILAAGSPGF